MIIWLASYPTSGEEIIRSFLSSYIFSQDGKFNVELVNNIKQFPDKNLFKQLGVDTNNEEEMYKNYINSQKLYSGEKSIKSIRFLKTHGCFISRKDFQFTDKHNTLGVIYIVRDPRNILIPLSEYSQQTIKQSLKNLLTHQYLNKNSKEHCLTYLGSWKYHYNSWKVFNKYNRYCLIKYEDLIQDREKVFIEVLKFISRMGKIKFSLNKDKFQNTLNTIDLEKIQYSGLKNDRSSADKKSLSEEIKITLENELKIEMKELDYLK